ncbi:MAG: helix-turn-helix domain-containing protein [Anaerolineaceae bacterium]|nr:helix-turn-helix domain-containing protein [Anaerolineaceae bacterium]
MKKIVIYIICLIPFLFGILTTKDVAEILGINIRTVHSLIKRARLPAEKFGRDWLVKVEDLEIYKENRRRPGRPKKIESDQTELE